MQAFPDAHRILYEGQSGGTITPTIFKNAFKDAFVNFSSSTFSSSVLKQALDSIKGMPGRGQFLDFYDSVKIKQGSSFNDDSFRVSASTVMSRNNLLFLHQKQYMVNSPTFNDQIGGSGPQTLTSTKGYYLKTPDEGMLDSISEAPFEMSFSNVGSFAGNGPAGIGLSTQGFGYLVLPQETTFLQSPTDNSAKYPNWSSAQFSNQDYSGDFDFGSDTYMGFALGFVPPWILENFNAKRLIVDGSQGTGKTIIAEEIAKQKLLHGSVLFISSGRLRNEETKQRFKEFDNFDCFTFHNFIHRIMKDIIKKEIPKDLSDKINSLKFEDKTEFFLKFISDTILDTENLKKYDYLIMDEVQNYCHYQELYGVIGSILNGDLKEGNWFLFGDFDFQNLWSAKKSDELIKTNPKNYLNNFKDYYYFLNYNVRNAQQITVHAPLISGIFEGKFPSRPFFIKIEGSIKHHYGKNEKEKIFKLEKIIEDFYNQQINGSDIVILSSYRIENTKNILGKSNISKFYDIVDLTQIKTFGKEIIDPRNKKTIYFSTIQGFQGMESKIVILLDPLSSPVEEKNENFAEYSYGKNFKNLITYNAMGRANTLLHIIWDKIHEKYTSQQIGKALKLQDEILNG